MKHFSKNTLKNAKVVFALKEELKSFTVEHEFDEVDLYKIADEIADGYLYERVEDKNRDPGMRRDYRNYDLDRAFDTHQRTIFASEMTSFEEDDPIDQLDFSTSILGAVSRVNGTHYV